MRDTKNLIIREEDSFIAKEAKRYANSCIFDADKTIINAVYHISEVNTLHLILKYIRNTGSKDFIRKEQILDYINFIVK